MKFQRSDLGLYFASSLVGAGVGLLVGSFIASRLAAPEPPFIPEEEDEGWDEEYWQAPEKIPGVKKSRKKTTKIKVSDDPELAAFIAEWEPSTIQIEMVKKGLVTLEDLQQTLAEERLAEEKEPYSYNLRYYDDKPDLADLVKLPEDEELVDDRYQILRDPPKNKDPKALRVVYWDMQDDGFYTLSRKKQPVPTDIRTMISDETWEVMLPYLHGGYTTLYVDDLETTRFYRFEVVPDDMEDSSGPDHASD